MSAPEMINELKRLSNVVTGLESMIAQQIISNTNLTDMIAQQVTTNTNLTNSVIELQASNVNLANMIAQQVITNTNLTNSIIELQNQVALQTTTNTNLTNMITELQTSVTRLTTITGQLVTVNTRALDNTDIPHDTIPYDAMSIIKNNAGVGWTLIQGNAASITINSADWGAGLDFYPLSLTLTVTCANHRVFETIDSEILATITEFTAPATYVWFWRQRWNYMDGRAGFQGALGNWDITEYVHGQRINSGNDLLLYVENKSGNTIILTQAIVVGFPL